MKIQSKIGPIRLSKIPVLKQNEEIELTFTDVPAGWAIKWIDPKTNKILGEKPLLQFQNDTPGTYQVQSILEKEGEKRLGPVMNIEVAGEADYISRLASAGISRVIDKIEMVADKFPTPEKPSPTTLQRTTEEKTKDIVLWSLIRHCTGKQFVNFQKEIDSNICADPRQFYGMDAYENLKKLTFEFLKKNIGTEYDLNQINTIAQDDPALTGLSPDEIKQFVNEYFSELCSGTSNKQSGRLPYLHKVGRSLIASPPDKCQEVLNKRLCTPIFIELIWSYWHEEGMLVQTLNAISLRFQNKKRTGGKDPLGHLEIAPLLPLSNLLWGYIQDEHHRLTLTRRAYEYDHHYGLTLYGKAVPQLQAADSRSKFLEAFHSLLHLCSIYYKEMDDTTVYADSFPVLNSLRDVHLLLAEGAHNQYGDLPWTARAEMLMQQWLLSRPEMRDFLAGRAMVPYEEPWIERVDTMKKLQGWTDVTVTHFHNLAIWGEQVLLSIRFGDWNDSTTEPKHAGNWAAYWRSQIQGYIYAYRFVTGVDLTATTAADKVDATLPSVHLHRRLAMQRQK